MMSSPRKPTLRKQDPWQHTLHHILNLFEQLPHNAMARQNTGQCWEIR
jgi:hypothetical protein